MTRRAAAITLAALPIAGHAHAGPIALRVGGSSVLAPLVRIWARDYAGLHPEVSLLIASTDPRLGV